MWLVPTLQYNVSKTKLFLKKRKLIPVLYIMLTSQFLVWSVKSETFYESNWKVWVVLARKPARGIYPHLDQFWEAIALG